jgi:uncharacterized membrane protein
LTPPDIVLTVDVNLDWVFWITILSVVGSLAVTVGTTVLIVGAIVWAVRRARPSPEDTARAELGRRLAAGEISPAEYQVRMRSIDDAAD